MSYKTIAEKLTEHCRRTTLDGIIRYIQVIKMMLFPEIHCHHNVLELGTNHVLTHAWEKLIPTYEL